MINKKAQIQEGTKIWHPHLSNIGNCKIGKNSVVHSHVWIGDNVTIGNNCKIQAFTFIPDGVDIEDNVFIGPRVTFTNDPKLKVKGREGWEKTLVQSYAKIGAGAIINAGVTLGWGCTIGAGAVVLSKVGNFELWVGVPAKFVRNTSIEEDDAGPGMW